jgi:Na+-driven multidrug efflux pump
MAAFTNGLKIESAIFLPAFAFSMAGAVMVGNRLGKGDDTEAFRSGVVTALMGVAVVSVLTILVMLNAGRIAGFLSDNPVVIDQCKIYIYIALISEPLMAWGVILGGGLNGAGDTMSVMLATSLTVWLIRLPLAYIIGIRTGCGAVAIWWAMNLSVLMQAVFITWRYFNKRWIVAARALSD